MKEDTPTDEEQTELTHDPAECDQEHGFQFTRRMFTKSAIAGGVLAGFGIGGASIVSAQQSGLSITDLTGSLTPEALAESLVATNTGLSIIPDSVQFTGDDVAGGQFSGGGDIIGIDDGVILSSGKVTGAEGPNDQPSTSTPLFTPGDNDLEEIADAETNDAAVLEFDFTVPDDADTVSFKYVFGSEEYNGFVGSEFNDVFGFILNGENVALVPDPDNPGETLPAAINNINQGQPGVPPTNPELYRNNDPFNPDSDGTTVPQDEVVNTEMDGFTVVLDVEESVEPGSTNTLRLAIADIADMAYDSWVFIGARTLTTQPDTLRIEGSGEYTPYSFSVNGSVTLSEEDTEETITDSTAYGAVGPDSDTYTFEGDLTDLYVGGNATVYVNDEKVDPSSVGSDVRSVTFKGTGSYASYEFSVSGAIQHTIYQDQEDSFSGSQGSGAVTAGKETYFFTGTLENVTTDGDVAITVNGEQFQD